MTLLRRSSIEGVRHLYIGVRRSTCSCNLARHKNATLVLLLLCMWRGRFTVVDCYRIAACDLQPLATVPPVDAFGVGISACCILIYYCKAFEVVLLRVVGCLLVSSNCGQTPPVYVSVSEWFSASGGKIIKRVVVIIFLCLQVSWGGFCARGSQCLTNGVFH